MSPVAFLIVFLLGALSAPRISAGPILTGAVPQAETLQRDKRSDNFSKAMEYGQKALQEGEIEDAIAHFKEAVAIDPRSGEAHMFLGFAYRVSGSYELLGEAKAELRQALAINPGLVWARIYLGRIYLDLGRLRNARQELEGAVQRHPSTAQAVALLAEVYRQEEDLEKALKSIERARELAPELIDVHYYSGLVYRDLDRLAEAERELEIAADSDQANPDIFLGLADVYAKQGRHDEAAKALQEGLSMDNSRPDLHMELATAFRLSERRKDARKELEWLYANESRFLGTPYFEELRARMRFEDGLLARLEGKQKEARSLFHAVLELVPDHGKAHEQLAQLYYEDQSFDKAVQHAEAARQAGNPTDPQLLEKILRHRN